MSRPVVIVDPKSSGAELAPTFSKMGIPSVAVILNQENGHQGFGAATNESDFVQVFNEQDGLVEKIRDLNPIAILPGAEGGVPLANELSAILTPKLAHDQTKNIHRIHKFYMQKALEEAGVPALKSINSNSESEVSTWLTENNLVDKALIVKPPISAGSDRVFHINPRENWQEAFREILANDSFITGKTNESVVVQEQAIGTEFSVGTVSVNGTHYLAHLIKYSKISYNGRKTIYDHVEFVPLTEEYQELFEYTKNVLDALGVKWGAAHNEIMLTKDGPRLIESVPRMTGGPVVQFAREATGSSQADKLAEAIVYGDVRTKEFGFQKSVVPVFLKSPKSARVRNREALNQLDGLSTLFKKFIFFEDGEKVPKTVDYLTSIGIVALSGDRESIFSDYARVREIEKKLEFV